MDSTAGSGSGLRAQEGVGLIDDFSKTATLAFKQAGETILLVGETTGWLGQSMYLREICRREEGAPPPVDLTEERENGDFVRALILEGAATAAHDLSDGGLLVGLAEMAMASGIGAQLSAAPSDIPAHAHWFGEDQARYLVTVPVAKVDAVVNRARAANVPVWTIGKTGGEVIAAHHQEYVKDLAYGWPYPHGAYEDQALELLRAHRCHLRSEPAAERSPEHWYLHQAQLIQRIQVPAG